MPQVCPSVAPRATHYTHKMLVPLRGYANAILSLGVRARGIGGARLFYWVARHLARPVGHQGSSIGGIQHRRVLPQAPRHMPRATASTPVRPRCCSIWKIVAQAATVEVVAARGTSGHRAESAGAEDAVCDPLGESLAEQRIAQIGRVRRLPGVAELVGERAEQQPARQRPLDVDRAATLRAHEEAQHMVTVGHGLRIRRADRLVLAAYLAHAQPRDDFKARTLVEGSGDLREGP